LIGNIAITLANLFGEQRWTKDQDHQQTRTPHLHSKASSIWVISLKYL